jgi:hypothetical protein
VDLPGYAQARLSETISYSSGSRSASSSQLILWTRTGIHQSCGGSPILISFSRESEEAVSATNIEILTLIQLTGFRQRLSSIGCTNRNHSFVHLPTPIASPLIRARVEAARPPGAWADFSMTYGWQNLGDYYTPRHVTFTSGYSHRTQQAPPRLHVVEE